MALKIYDIMRKEHKAKGLQDLEPLPSFERPPERQTEDFSEGRRGRPMSSWKKIAVIAGALVFVVGLYLAGTLFVHATVTIVQRHIPFSLQNASLEVANEKKADPSKLSFQTMVVTDSVTRQVFGSVLSTSTTKATGKAVIFNQYSKTAKTIKSGTTLTAANGLKYVTQGTVVVPGYTGTGTTKAAGSITVPIVAAAAGPTYNSNGSTFTVAGYTGTVAKSFFASSGPISGGQNGTVHALSEADRQQAMTTLQAALTEKLARETRAQIPDDLVTFPDLQSLSIDTAHMVLQGSTIQFPATLSGTMVSYLIPRELFEQALARKAINDHLYPSVSIPDLGGVTVHSLSALPNNPDNEPDSLTIAVSGQGTIITKVPAATIQQSVVGIARGTFTQALAGIAEIDTATYSLTPFWAPYFPYKPERITVKIQ